MSGSYRFFDHTGDFGVDLEAADAAGVIEQSALAFVALLTGGGQAPGAPQLIAERDARELSIEGVDALDLLVGVGNELLFLFEAQGWLVARITVDELTVDELSGERLRARAFGEPFAPDRHPIARPIKAVTHHGARLEATDDGRWRGRLVYDL